MPLLFAHTCQVGSRWLTACRVCGRHLRSGRRFVLLPYVGRQRLRSFGTWVLSARRQLSACLDLSFSFVHAECFAGSFSEEGSETCTTCPPHSSSDKGASTCVCQAGYVASGSGQSLTCTRTCVGAGLHIASGAQPGCG